VTYAVQASDSSWNARQVKYLPTCCWRGILKWLMNEDLADYLCEAWELNRRAYTEPGPGRLFRSPMFTFVRRAKAHPDLEGLTGLEAATLVERCLDSWGKMSDDPWRTWFPESDDAKSEFVDTWGRIKWARAALQTAQLSAVKLPLNPRECYSPGYGSFVSLAGHLQRNVQGSILLPCRKIAAVLNCEPMTISRYRRLAIQDGLLQLVARGIRSQRKADEFRFAVEMFDWETGEQTASVNLNICVTSQSIDGGCYADTQDKQESERFTDSQKKMTEKEIEEKQEKKRTLIADETKKCALRRGPYVPTSAELAEALERTVNVRRGYIT
jgi:hypothetical protein